MPKCSVLIIEDEKNIQTFMGKVLKRQDYRVLYADNGQQGLEIIRSQCPDIILLDLGLPDMNGSEIIRDARTWTSTPIIVISARTAEHEKVTALDLGADDYITKPFKLGELCSRIRALLRRSTLQNPSDAGVICSGPVTVDQTAAKAYLDGKYLDLTGAEYRLLSLLIRHDGQTLTRNFILDELWDGQGNFVDDNTLSVYIRRLREKIEEHPSHPEHLLTVRGMGYRWEGEQ